MKKKPRFEQYEYKREYLLEHQKGNCYLTGEPIMPGEKIDLHHCLHRTALNCKLYPIFIDSLLNLRLEKHDAHLGMRKTIRPQINYTAHRGERYEKFLERHPVMARMVNGGMIPGEKTTTYHLKSKHTITAEDIK